MKSNKEYSYKRPHPVLIFLVILSFIMNFFGAMLATFRDLIQILALGSSLFLLTIAVYGYYFEEFCYTSHRIRRNWISL